MGPDWFLGLVAWAVVLSGYPLPENPPILVFVPHEVLESVVCPQLTCPVLGMYLGGNKIYVQKDLSKTQAEEVIVHEIVHYLQTMKYGFMVDCLARADREMEAYGVSGKYQRLHYRDNYTKVPVNMRLNCK